MGGQHRPQRQARRTAAVAAALAAAVVVPVGLSALPQPDPAPTVTVQVAQPPATTMPSATTKPVIVVHRTANTLAEGQAIAGDTITPGLWITAGGASCRWSRNAGASWETSGTPSQQIVVSLRAGATFETYGCAPWHLYRERQS